MELLLWGLGILAFLFLIAIIAGISQANSNADRANTGKARLNEMGSSNSYTSISDGSCLGINWESRKIYTGILPDIHTYDFDLLHRVDIDVDGTAVTTTESTTKTRRGAQVAGAAVGGLAFGPVGLLIGGFTGGNKTSAISIDKKLISSIAIVLHFRDRINPVQYVTFFKWEMTHTEGLEYNNLIIKKVVQEANHFHSLLGQIVEENRGSDESDVEDLGGEVPDVTDQLERLWNLRQAGALTEDEFETRKRRLLRS